MEGREERLTSGNPSSSPSSLLPFSWGKKRAKWREMRWVKAKERWMRDENRTELKLIKVDYSVDECWVRLLP